MVLTHPLASIRYQYLQNKSIIIVSMQILDLTGTPLTEWFPEVATLLSHFDGCPRLSGSEMRQRLYLVCHTSRVRVYRLNSTHELTRFVWQNTGCILPPHPEMSPFMYPGGKQTLSGASRVLGSKVPWSSQIKGVV